jgi:hypothetical protein
MFSQWLWIAIFIMIHTHRLSIIRYDLHLLSQHSTPCSNPLAQNNTPWFTTTGSEKHHDSQPLALKNTAMYYSEPVVVNHGVLFWASRCESWFAKLNQWLWIMSCYVEPVVVNSYVFFRASGCESWCFSVPVVVNHGVLFWASGFEHGVLCW